MRMRILKVSVSEDEDRVAEQIDGYMSLSQPYDENKVLKQYQRTIAVNPNLTVSVGGLQKNKRSGAYVHGATPCCPRTA